MIFRDQDESEIWCSETKTRQRREILTNFWEVLRPRLEFRPTLLCAPFLMNVDNCLDPCSRILEKQTYKFTIFHANQSSLQPVLEKVIVMSNQKATFAKIGFFTQKITKEIFWETLNSFTAKLLLYTKSISVKESFTRKKTISMQPGFNWYPNH